MRYLVGAILEFDMNQRGRLKKRTPNNLGMSLQEFFPLNEKQKLVFESNKNVVMHGCAGTGKSFVASYLGYKALLSGEYKRIVYLRSTVQTRNMGFMPGNEEEKIKYYESPYVDIAAQLFGTGNAYEILKNKQLVHFMSTAFIRGITLEDAFIIVDECQNMDFQELDSINTRIGSNSKVMYCGDIRQKDLEKSGLSKFFNILKNMDSFDFIDFKLEDIVRSNFVKEYLTTKYRIEDEESCIVS